MNQDIALTGGKDPNPLTVLILLGGRLSVAELEAGGEAEPVQDRLRPLLLVGTEIDKGEDIEGSP